MNFATAVPVLQVAVSTVFAILFCLFLLVVAGVAYEKPRTQRAFRRSGGAHVHIHAPSSEVIMRRLSGEIRRSAR